MHRPTTHGLFILLLGLGTVHGFESNALADSKNRPRGGTEMSKPGNTGGDSGSEKPVQPDDKSNVVITPAGPIPKDKVHLVRPGETVRRNKDGNLQVVPANKKGGERE
jgi:hypothetical protein